MLTEPPATHWLIGTVPALVLSVIPAGAAIVDQSERPAEYTIEHRLEPVTDGGRDFSTRFSPDQLALLEKLNRVDVKHMGRLDQLVVPSTWQGELAYSPFPLIYAAAVHLPKLIVVDQPKQAFAAYESGRLAHWGPTSTGRQAKPTPKGLFHLNWRARSRTSTLSGEWRLDWYFNFHNTRGIAFHQFDLPGLPASHACVRLLERDARWIYEWGQSWTLDAKGQLLTTGTPVLVLGDYVFDAPPPWRSLDPVARVVWLPEIAPQQ